MENILLVWLACYLHLTNFQCIECLTTLPGEQCYQHNHFHCKVPKMQAVNGCSAYRYKCYIPKTVVTGNCWSCYEDALKQEGFPIVPLSGGNITKYKAHLARFIALYVSLLLKYRSIRKLIPCVTVTEKGSIFHRKKYFSIVSGRLCSAF